MMPTSDAHGKTLGGGHGSEKVKKGGEIKTKVLGRKNFADPNYWGVAERKTVPNSASTYWRVGFRVRYDNPLPIQKVDSSRGYFLLVKKLRENLTDGNWRSPKGGGTPGKSSDGRKA